MVAPFFETIYAYSFIFGALLSLLEVYFAGIKLLDALQGF
jgi:hypothetical protein